MKEKRGGARKALAFLLTIAMVCTYSVPITAFGGTGDTTGNNAWQIVSGGGSGTTGSATPVTTVGSVKDHSWSVSTTKTVYPTATENEFEIELKVKTSEDVSTISSQNVEIALVIDTSGSMVDKGRIGNAKAAAKSFVKSLLTATSSGIKIGLVSFAEYGNVVAGMTTNAAILNGSIDTLIADGGTFMQAGLKKAQDMLNEGDKNAQKFIVVLGDGGPTYRYDYSVKEKNLTGKDLFEYGQLFSGKPYLVETFDYKDRDGTGKYVSEDNIAATVTEAMNIKEKGTVIYAVGCGSLSNDEQRILRNVSTAPSSGNYFANVTDTNMAETLAKTFKTISENIVTAAEAWRVTDEMGEFVKLDGPVKDGWKDYGVTVEAQNNNEAINWNLRDLTGQTNCREEVEGGYEYTLRYKIKLDTEAEGFDPDASYNTNGPTELDFVINSDVDNTQKLIKRTLNFVSPVVKGNLPAYDDLKVTYYTTDENGDTPVFITGDKVENPVSIAKSISKGTAFGVAAVGYEENQRGQGKFLSPADYEAGVIQNPQATVTSGSIISVYYKAIPKYGYTVEYYKSDDGKETFIATESGVKLPIGTTVSAVAIDKHKPDNYSWNKTTYGTNGTDGFLTITDNEGKNVIKVFYKENTKNSYRIESYIVGQGTPFHTTTPGIKVHAGISVKLAAKDVAENVIEAGKRYHVTSEFPMNLTISAVANENVFKVYYAEDKKYDYTVEYYKGTDKVGAATEKYTNFGYAGTTAAAFKGPGSGFENWHQISVEYVGAEKGQQYITLKDGTNLIKVVYAEDEKYDYTVNYWKYGYNENVENAKFITSAAVAKAGYADKKISLSDKQKNENKPDHYSLDDVNSQLSVILKADGKNEMNVYFKEDQKYGYTVEYYLDGVKQSNWTDPDASKVYYEGAIVAKVKSYNEPNSGYREEIIWPDKDSGNLKISSNLEHNKIIVNYYPKDGIQYAVEVYLQKADGGYDKADSTTGAGVANTTFSAEQLYSEYSSKAGFAYDHSTGINSKNLGGVPVVGYEYKVAGDGSAVLQMYFNQISQKLTVKHTYPGTEPVVLKDGVTTQVSSKVVESVIRKYGYMLDYININGVKQDKLAFVNMEMPNANLEVEFVYKKGEAKNLLIHHYDGDGSSITSGDAIDEITLNVKNEAGFDFTALINTLGDTYKAVGIWYNQKVIPMIIVELEAALQDAKDAYNNAIGSLNQEAVAAARARADDANDITTLTAIKADATTSYAAMYARLESEAADRNNISTLTAIKLDAEDVFNTSNGALEAGTFEITPANGTIPAVMAPSKSDIGFVASDVVTLGALADKQAAADKALADAETEQARLARLAGGMTSLQEELNAAQKTLGGTSKEIDGKDVSGAAIKLPNPAYAEAEAAVAAIQSKLDEANKAMSDLLEAENKVAEAQALCDKIALYTKIFRELRDNSGLTSAEINLNEAIAKARTQTDENAAKSEERKALDKAIESLNAAQNKADGEYEKAIFGMMSIDENLKKYAKDLETAEDGLKAALAENNDVTYGEAHALVQLLEDHQYTVNIVYEKVAPENPNPPENPDRPDRPNRPTPPPAIIEDEGTPLGDAPAELKEEVIEEPEVPLADLPKTGGVGSLGFLGIGAAIAALGAVLRRKEDNE